MEAATKHHCVGRAPSLTAASTAPAVEWHLTEKKIANFYLSQWTKCKFLQGGSDKKIGYYWRYVLTETEWQHQPFSDIFYGVLQHGMLRSVFLCWPMELLVSQHSVRATEESMQPRPFFFSSPIGERWAGGGATAGRRHALCCKCSLKCHSSNMLPVNSR